MVEKKRRPPPPGASAQELLDYYGKEPLGVHLTRSEKAMYDGHKCVDCGVTVAAIRCEACSKELLKARVNPDWSMTRYAAGAGVHSVGREYHRRLGYGSGEAQTGPLQEEPEEQDEKGE